MHRFTSRVYRRTGIPLLSLSLSLSISSLCWFLRVFFSRSFRCSFLHGVSSSHFDPLLSTWLLSHGPLCLSLFPYFSLSHWRTNSSLFIAVPTRCSLPPRLLLSSLRPSVPSRSFLSSHRRSIPSSVSSAVINLAGGIPEGYLTLIYELAILRPTTDFFFLLLVAFSPFPSFVSLAPRSARFLVPRDKPARKRRPPRRTPVSRRTFPLENTPLEGLD